MRVIYTSKGMSKKVCGMRYTLGALYLSKNTVNINKHDLLKENNRIKVPLKENITVDTRGLLLGDVSIHKHGYLKEKINKSIHELLTENIRSC
jgi:GTP cyclohydrolase II